MLLSIRYASLAFVLVLGAVPAKAQVESLQPATRTAFQSERALIETTLETVVAVLQGATFQDDYSPLGDRLREITQRLVQATTMTPENEVLQAASSDDLAALRDLLLDVRAQLEALRDEVQAEQADFAARLDPIANDLAAAALLADRLAEENTADMAVTLDDGTRWLRPGRYGDGKSSARSTWDRDEDLDETDEWADDDVLVTERVRRDERRDTIHQRRRANRWRSAPFSRRSYMGTVVGEMSYRWPFRDETALYRPIPAIRYNRVEGIVLGLGREPMDWDDYDRGRLYGQGGYAFALEDWRFEAGAEVRLDRLRRDDYGLKVGASYRRNTTTDDLWKTSWLENTLAAFFFEHDFFDYHEVEGLTVYAVQRVTPYAQVSAGYRTEEHRSLTQNTGWSLFDGDHFRFNPAVSEGRMQSFLVTFEGGRVWGLNELPRGGAFRLEAELGDGWGGDFAFNRYVGDGRAYLPLTHFSSLALRLRGGAVSGDHVPLQKTFALGGVGSMRGYPQNLFGGTRMLLGNAEYVVEGADLFDELFDEWQLIGFIDAGWTNGLHADVFDFDDVLPSAGVGLGLGDRAVRLELAWPLRDIGFGQEPSLWFRVAPSF